MLSTIKSYYSHWMLVGVFLFTPFLMPSAQAEYLPKGDETAQVSVQFGGPRYQHRSFRRHHRRGGPVIYYGPRYQPYYSPYYYDPYYYHYPRRGGVGVQFRIR